METLLEILRERFVWGLLLGLLIAGFAWKNGFTATRNKAKEIKRLEQEMSELQGHLNTQLKINASGNEALDKELAELKVQNENLRVNLSTVQQKPDKTELKYLHINEQAVRLMREQAPGFASAWEQALRTAEEEYAQSESGLSKLVRKVMPKLSSTAPARLEDKEIEAEEV